MAVSWVLDGMAVESPDGETILEAAHKVGVAIPTLCWSGACGSQARCMICSVEDESSSRLLPACAATPQPGVSILTASPKVVAHRKTTLGWLLGEHRGDCLAPCQLACPAGLDVPAILAGMEAGDSSVARQAMGSQLALSEVLGYLCDAPCERVCHRGRVDESVAIRSFERLPVANVKTRPGREGVVRVVVVGGGVSGLATAEYLALGGASVSIFEAADRLGGSLLLAIAESKLPEGVLDRALRRLDSLGVTSRIGRTIKKSELNHLQESFDAVVWAPGGPPDADAQGSLPEAGLQDGMGERYVVGGALRGGRSVAAHVGDARRVAAAILSQPLPIFRERFSTSILPMNADEWTPFLHQRQAGGSLLAPLGPGETASPDTVVAEASRCLQCSCPALSICDLRKLAMAERVRPVRSGGRRRAGRRDDHPRLILESGKCIACGICVARCLEWPELPGLGWHGRGTDLTIQPPPGVTLNDAVGEHGEELAESCPTGALMAPASRREQ